jgi:hypothetical protein
LGLGVRAQAPSVITLSDSALRETMVRNGIVIEYGVGVGVAETGGAGVRY